MLARFNCAFVAEGEARAGIEDLILGCLVCSMRCDEFAKFVESDQFWKEMRKWGRTISGNFGLLGILPYIGKWWRKHHSFNVVEKIALFKRYIEESSRVPTYSLEKEMEGGGSVGHWSQGLEVVLRGELNWTGEEINEEPLSKAFADYFRWAENQGAVRLISPEEIESGKANAAAIEAALKEAANGS